MVAILRTTALAASLLLALARPASAQQTGDMTVYGVGKVSCGAWLDARANRYRPNDMRYYQATQWVAGFVTAVNLYDVYARPGGGDLARSTDLEGVYTWLDGYCRENPTSVVMDAVLGLVQHLKTH